MENKTFTELLNCKKIGIIDSGVGGLTLLNRLDRSLKGVKFYYAADNYNMPYGNLSADEILLRADKLVKALLSFGVKNIVLACNTITSVCLEKLKVSYDVNFFGVLPPVKACAEYAYGAGGSAIVLATASTAASNAFLLKLAQSHKLPVRVYSPVGLAFEIEKNIFDLNAVDIEKHIPMLLSKEIKAVALGCTHYVFLEKIIKNKYGKSVFYEKLGTDDHFQKKSLKPNKLNEINYILGDLHKNETVYKHYYNSN